MILQVNHSSIHLRWVRNIQKIEQDNLWMGFQEIIHYMILWKDRMNKTIYDFCLYVVSKTCDICRACMIIWKS